MSIKSLYPDIRPSLNLNFANSKALDGRITFTRNSTATYVGANGLIQTAQRNAPRFDHDPVTGESLGLLIEDQRTNIVTGVGGATNAILTSGQNNELTGNEDAYLYQKNASSSAESPIAIPVSGSVSTDSFTYSAFVKPGTSNKIYFQTVANNLSDNAYHYFNIGDNTSVSVDYASSGNLTYTRTITPLHSGWYRLSVTIFGFSDTSLYLSQVRIGSFAGTTTHNYTNTTDTFYFYGPQVENGSFPTSYIPTSGSTVTRIKDDALMTGASFESWINKNEGTWFIEYKLVGESIALMSISGTSGSVNERYMMWNIGVADEVSNAVVDGGVIQANLSDSITSSLTQFTKAIFAGKDNDFAMSANGQTPITDTSGTIYNSPTQLRFAYGNGSSTPNAHFKSCIYYPKRLTNAQLQLLTQ